jgi:hypothetical protein
LELLEDHSSGGGDLQAAGLDAKVHETNKRLRFVVS